MKQVQYYCSSAFKTVLVKTDPFHEEKDDIILSDMFHFIDGIRSMLYHGSCYFDGAETPLKNRINMC